MITAVLVTGQTGTGKTALALTMARKNRGDIISVDARQIYKLLTIVTGKDIGTSRFVHIEHFSLDGNRTADIGYYELDGVRIWGYDLVNPNEIFSSHDFKIVCAKIVSHLSSGKKMPIFVGGSYLYIRDLELNFNVESPPNWKLREILEKKTVGELQELLKKEDLEIFNALNESDRANPRRLIRKIEIARAQNSEKKIHTTPNEPLITFTKKIGLRFSSTEKCSALLKKRVSDRINQGALLEVASLLNAGYSESSPGLNTIGYKQLIAHLKGSISLDEAIQQWIQAEVAYAKRQYTFMKKDSNIIWRDV